MKEYKIISEIKKIIDNELNIIGDDTAIIPEDGTVLTCDTLVEDVHFRKSTISPFDLGYKAIAVNLSDIAASGGDCKYILVALSVPKNIDINYITELYKGMKSICDEFNVKIAGGDLTSSEKIVITVFANGHTRINSSRSNAQTHQKIIVTGEFGTSFAGLLMLENPEIKTAIPDETRLKIISKHLKPYPKIKEVHYLTQTLKYQSFCLMDTSDGLADALFQIGNKSKKRLIISPERIPVNPKTIEYTLKLGYNPLDVPLFGGEDYEIISCCNETDLAKITGNTQYKFTEIGHITDDKPGVTLVYRDCKVDLTEELLAKKISFRHF